MLTKNSNTINSIFETKKHLYATIEPFPLAFIKKYKKVRITLRI